MGCVLDGVVMKSLAGVLCNYLLPYCEVNDISKGVIVSNHKTKSDKTKP